MSNANLEVWIGQYRLSNQIHGVALGYANSRESFNAQMNAYCQSQGVSETHQLAPIPLLTWIKRHGMRWDYWQFAEQLDERQSFLFFPEETLNTPPAFIADVCYLGKDSKAISELGRQFGKRFPLPVSAVLNDAKENGFFAQMDWYVDYADEAEAPKVSAFEGQIPNYYLVVDAEKSFFFPSDFDWLKNECLYKGQSYETANDIAPYLVEIKAGDRKSREFVQKLFTWHESNVHSHWDINPTIFIRSYHDFNTVFNHLRKFTHLLGTNDAGEEKWYFFRFYDPAVLVPYLQGIAYHPNHLASFFGAKVGSDNRVIDAFGARIDEVFYTFGVKPLPEGTVSAKIELGTLEWNIFNDIAQNKLLDKLFHNILPNEFSSETLVFDEVKGYLQRATELGFNRKGTQELMVKAQLYLKNHQQQIDDIINQINETYGCLSQVELAKMIYNAAMAQASK